MCNTVLVASNRVLFAQFENLLTFFYILIVFTVLWHFLFSTFSALAIKGKLLTGCLWLTKVSFRFLYFAICQAFIIACLHVVQVYDEYVYVFVREIYVCMNTGILLQANLFKLQFYYLKVSLIALDFSSEYANTIWFWKLENREQQYLQFYTYVLDVLLNFN